MPKVKEYTKSGLVSLGRLKKAIKDGNYVNGFTHLSKKGNIIEVWGDAIADESGMDTEVSSHDGLTDYKAKALKQIREKDEIVLSKSTFTFDSKNFGLSAAQRALWDSIKNGKTDITFPLDITTQEGETYSLAVGNLNNFWLTALGTTKAVYDGSRALKNAVYNATNKAEVDAVEDNR